MVKALHSQYRRSERGVALVVALVLVLVSTLLGVSAMQGSDIETQLASNMRFQQASFRAAEAAADGLLTMDNVIAVANDFSTEVQSTSSINEGITVQATFGAYGDGLATGYSLGGQNGFRTLKFIARASASIDAVDSSSRVVQGIERLTPFREQ